MDQIDLSDLENPNAIPEPKEGPDNPYEQAPEAPPDLSNKDPEERAKKMLKLKFYFDEFPDKLSMYHDINLPQLTGDQLDSLRAEINMIVNAQLTITQSVNTFQLGLYFIEAILTNHTPIRAQGLSALAKDKILLDNVKIFTLENIDIIKSKSKHCIAMRICPAILALHQANSLKETRGDLDKLNNEFVDL